MSRARFLAIMNKEFLHIIRDPRTLMLIFLIPIIQMTLLGYAATNDIDNVGMVLMDGDHTPESRALVQSFEATGYFVFTDYTDSEDEMTHLLDKGTVRGALVIPSGYAHQLLKGSPVQIGLIIDGSDPTVATTMLAAGQQTGQAYIQNLLGVRAAGGMLEVRPSVWYNPGLESVNFMIPALMGLILQFLATLLTSMAIVREREYGTMEQLIVTPIRPIELVLGKTVPYVLLSVFNLAEVLVIGTLWFGVPIKGSLLLLFTLSLLFLLGSLALGIVISTVSARQQEAMLMSFMILVPSIFLSGFFFPLEAMPGFLRVMSYMVPLRYMLAIVRSIVLKGVGFEAVRGEVIPLLILSVVILAVAANRFRKNLD